MTMQPAIIAGLVVIATAYITTVAVLITTAVQYY
jgi:hypothetical protein